jgi:hypothetical protein
MRSINRKGHKAITKGAKRSLELTQRETENHREHREIQKEKELLNKPNRWK